MKILLVGSWVSEVYQSTLAFYLEKHGAEVIPFRTQRYFQGLIGKTERYFCVRGIMMKRCEKALFQSVIETRPEIVFVWQCEWLSGAVLRRISNISVVKLVCYTNDDPFSPLYSLNRGLHARRKWSRFVKNIPLYDKHYVFRDINKAEFTAAGAPGVGLLRMYFDPRIHHPYRGEQRNGQHSDVIFIGHFEEGFKLDCLVALLNEGVNLEIYGQFGWDKPGARQIRELYGKPIKPVWGQDYADLISNSKIALCFLSRLNRDEYTTRSFEIPACGTLLLAERTSEHQDLFIEGEEAEFFDSAKEMVCKVKYLLSHPARIEEISKKGYERVCRDGHSASNRAVFLINDFYALLNGEKFGAVESNA